MPVANSAMNLRAGGPREVGAGEGHRTKQRVRNLGPIRLSEELGLGGEANLAVAYTSGNRLTLSLGPIDRGRAVGPPQPNQHRHDVDAALFWRMSSSILDGAAALTGPSVEVSAQAIPCDGLGPGCERRTIERDVSDKDVRPSLEG